MKIRSIVISSIILTLPLFLCSCSLLFGDNQMAGSTINGERDEANARMDKLLEALGNKDKEAVKSMFSQKVINSAENFDSNLDELLEFYQGDFVSYDDKGSLDTEDTRNGNERLKILYSTYDVTTTEQIYRIAIRDIIIDTKNEESVGICSFYIIKFEDDTDTRYGYAGDLKYTPGINLNIKNVIPYEIFD